MKFIDEATIQVKAGDSASHLRQIHGRFYTCFDLCEKPWREDTDQCGQFGAIEGGDLVTERDTGSFKSARTLW